MELCRSQGRLRQAGNVDEAIDVVHGDQLARKLGGDACLDLYTGLIGQREEVHAGARRRCKISHVERRRKTPKDRARMELTAVKERMPGKHAMRHGHTRVSSRTWVGSGQDGKQGCHG
jgi:hypothetical protein